VYFSYISLAFLLGLRHGVDFDHVAAIFDIVGTTTSVQSSDSTSAACGRRYSLWLALLYVIGHATVVLALGLAALLFSAALPDWIDPFMERIIGITLVAMGIWVLYSLVLFIQGKQEFRLASRWMMVISWFQSVYHKLIPGLSSNNADARQVVQRYGDKTAFAVGMLHGIGAETGTQVLILAAACKVESFQLGVGLLMAFVLGLFAANTILSVLGAAGFNASLKLKGVYIVSGFLVALFSLFVGSMFLLGQAQALPGLEHLLGTCDIWSLK
jgi:high-affinity nickel-transport protein